MEQDLVADIDAMSQDWELVKQAFQPAPPMPQQQMGPPQPGMAPPMDPNMAPPQPGMDPNMAPPMDPAAAGPPPGGAAPDDIIETLQAIAEATTEQEQRLGMLEQAMGEVMQSLGDGAMAPPAPTQ